MGLYKRVHKIADGIPIMVPLLALKLSMPDGQVLKPSSIIVGHDQAAHGRLLVLGIRARGDG